MTDLTNPIYNDDEAARAHLEAIRWPNGVICPHCGGVEGIHRLEGKKHRPGLWYCRACRGQFSVTVGTVFERSHVPLHKWVLATHLLASSKKGISAHQLHRTLGVTYKTAWFMAHRIREAMKDGNPGPLGGKGEIVEADETVIGPKNYQFKNDRGWRSLGPAYKVVTLVQREGKARSIKIDRIKVKTIREILVQNVDRNSVLMTDEGPWYTRVGREYKRHYTVQHRKGEYAKGEFITTNTVEGFFSIFKRGMKGVYQHCGEQHLQRYLVEFDFRYNNRVALGINDDMRAVRVLEGIEGKRLTYRRTDRAAA